MFLALMAGPQLAGQVASIIPGRTADRASWRCPDVSTGELLDRPSGVRGDVTLRNFRHVCRALPSRVPIAPRQNRATILTHSFYESFGGQDF